MVNYGAQELAAGFRTVRKNTILIAQDIPEGKYAFTPAPDVRSVAQTLVHIALANKFQHQVHAVERLTSIDGFDFPGLMTRIRAEENQPRDKAQIIDLLQTSGDAWADWLSGLSAEFLSEHVQMPKGATPAAKSRLEMLLSVKEHEMHHRGQLMLVERMLGIVPHLTRDMQARMAQAQERK
jgi:uncharacterized damage-inducible protein DinB